MQRGYKAVLTVVFIILPVLAFFSLIWADVQAESDDQLYADGRLGSTLPIIGGGGMVFYPGDEKWEPLLKNFDDRVEGEIKDIAAIGDDFYAGGCFYQIGGKAINNLARWDGQAWSAVQGKVNSCVTRMAVRDNSLYIAGDFTQIGTLKVSNLAFWDGSAWHPIENEFTSGITAMAFYGSDLIVAAQKVDGSQVKTLLSAWDGSTWRSFGELPDGIVYALLAHGKDLYIGGSFSSVNGQAIKGAARWDGSKWYSLGAGFTSTVDALAAVGDKIFAGMYSNDAPKLVYWDGTRWYRISSLDQVDYVKSLATVGDDLYIGGYFYNLQTAEGGTNGAARWDGRRLWNLGSGLTDSIFQPNFVYKLLAQDDRIYAVGGFSYAGKRTSYGLAVWHTKPEVSINYDSGAPGSTFMVRGRYFKAGSRVNFSINGLTLYPPNPSAQPVDVALADSGVFTADLLGNIAINVTTTSSTKPGPYQVTLEGVEDGHTQSFMVTVASGEPRRPVLTDPDIEVTQIIVPPTINPGAFYHFYLPGMISMIKPGR